MKAAELQPHQLMQRVAEFFESRGISYRVVGSVASMAYGEPRFTNDINMVAELPMEQVALLCAAFPAPEYYVSEQDARHAVARRFQFNIIHPASGLKVDVIVPPDTEFARSERMRARRITSAGEYSAWFGSPEDIILSKLVFYQQGGSEKHLRDIAGMARLLGANLDGAYIASWAEKLGVTPEWQLICERLQKSGG